MERDIKPTYDELESYVENLQKQLADAQATIAALQARVKELEEARVSSTYDRNHRPMPEELTVGAAKPTNPKDIVATTKLPLHLIPMITQAYLAIGHFNGLGKYGRDNWRASGVLASVYVSAALRHINSWNEGEELDPDDGVPHLMGAITSLSILIDAQYTGVLNDDRKYRGAGIPAQARGLAEAHVARLAKLHAGRWPKHYNIQDIELDAKEDVCRKEKTQGEVTCCDSASGKGPEAYRPVGVLARPGEFRTARG